MNWIFNIVVIVFFVNTLFAIVTVFKEKRDISATWAWLLVLNLLPGIGFLIYLFAGKKISKERIFDIKAQEKLGIDQLVSLQKEQWNEKELLPYDVLTNEAQQTSRLFLEADQAIFTNNNQVKVYTDGQEKFAKLLADIENAQDHIHIEYYTFYSDEIGYQVLDALEKAQTRGVNVRVIYDSMGSRGQVRNFFKPLEELGGQAEPFFGSKKSYFHSPRLNYRDHRKIVVIDGVIGYIGGFNIGDQYLGRLEKFGYWRDTHLRVVGNAAVALQSQFFMDWNATVKNSAESAPIEYADRYFPLQRGQGTTGIQIVSSGPDNETEAIKLGYLKLISNAHDYIYIQTPYLIPDDSVMEALSVAAYSGVKVRIMIPSKPDHAFVYRATEYYAKELLEKGIEIYKYDEGFLHAKTMVVDGQMCSVGSANLDFRSFKLNFEVNAFCYDRKLAVELTDIFKQDLKFCTLLSAEYFAQQSRWLRFKQYFSRLLSPIL
ncbi:MAG TPA: cardiolipin synthase [Candidatus Ligilactobacillus excrementavium]|nr:cardiolipin synthase [Candidatus Ligilactobacillus excrementavium]